MRKAAILISCHKESDFLQSDIFQPIQVGCALTNVRIPNTLRDDTGDNISDLNKMYCELTAQYWAWKNLESEYYGFFHYRRYLSFKGTDAKYDAWGNICEEYIDTEMITRYGLDDETILVSVMYVNNEIGAVEPIEEIGHIVKTYNPDIGYHVDAIQAYGKFSGKSKTMMLFFHGVRILQKCLIWAET